MSQKSDKLKTKKLALNIPKNSKSYLTHDNGSRPFKVVIYKNTKSNKQTVDIYKIEYLTNNYSSHTYTNKIASYIPEKIFIGKSPKNKMTSFSKGYGPHFDGNSILLCMNDKTNEYIFIGENIFSFKSIEHIVDFISPVGNSDVPYPYAIDNKKNYYFLCCGYATIDMNNISDNKLLSDPYEIYFNNKDIKKLKLKIKIIEKRTI